MNENEKQQEEPHIIRVVVAVERYVEFLELEWSDGRIKSVGSLGGIKHELKLTSDEFITEIWGRKGAVLNSIALFTNKERAFGPFGWAAGRFFESTSPKGQVLLNCKLTEGNYCGEIVVKNIEPEWGKHKSARISSWSCRTIANIRLRLDSASEMLSNASKSVSQVASLKLKQQQQKQKQQKENDEENEEENELIEEEEEINGLLLSCGSIGDEALKILKELSVELTENYNGLFDCILKSRLERLICEHKTLLSIIRTYSPSQITSTTSSSLSNNDNLNLTSFFIVSYGSTKERSFVLTVEDGSLANGAKITAMPRILAGETTSNETMIDANCQRFVFTNDGQIKSKKSGLVLAVSGEISAGKPIIQTFADHSQRQLWVYYPQDHSIRIGHNGELCLLLSPSSPDKIGRDAIVGYPCRDPSQQWSFQR